MCLQVNVVNPNSLWMIPFHKYNETTINIRETFLHGNWGRGFRTLSNSYERAFWGRSHSTYAWKCRKLDPPFPHVCNRTLYDWPPPPPTPQPLPCRYVLSFHLPPRKLKTRLTGPKIYPSPSAVHLRSVIVNKKNKKRFGNKNYNDQ